MLKYTKFLAALVLACSGCAAMAERPLPVADSVEIPRFMGKWYVIASIPTPFERDAYNATEVYDYVGDGKVATTFTYNKGSLDGPLRETNTTGFVSADNAAIWGMQFVWPFRADYRVAYVDDAHSVTIVAREKRDFVWLMARDPLMSDGAYAQHVQRIADMGYDTSKLVRIEHAAVEAATSIAGAAGEGG